MKDHIRKMTPALVMITACLFVGCGSDRWVESVETADIADATGMASVEATETLDTVEIIETADSTKTLQDYEYIENIQDFLTERRYEEDFHNPAQVRFELACIDQDDIPELLLCEGNSHIDGIVIYKYDPDDGKMEKVDFFSSFGRFTYVPFGNIVESIYGNHGYYTSVFTQIQDDLTVSIIDSVVSDGGGVRSAEILYYHGMDSDTYHGIYYETSKDSVSEEEYNDIINTLMGGQGIKIEYGDMISVTEENINNIYTGI